MTGSWRAALLVVRLGARLAPWLTAVTVLLLLAQTLAGTALAVGLQLIVDGLLSAETPMLVGGALTAAMAQTMIAMGGSILMVQRVLLCQRVGEHLDRDTLLRIAALPTLTDLEEPANAHRIELARRSGQRSVNSAWTMVSVVVTVVQILIALVLLASVDVMVAGLMLCTLPTLWSAVLAQRLVTRSRRTSAEADRSERSLFDACTDPDRAKELRLGGGADFARGVVADLWGRSTQVQIRGESRAALVQGLGWAVFLAGYLGALWVVGARVLDGRAAAGSLLLVATLATQIRANLAGVIGKVRDATESWESLQAYQWLRNRTEPVRDGGATGPLPPDRLVTGIRLKGITFRYPGSHRDALHDVTLDIAAGSTLAIVGGHGSGKSTLVKILCGLVEPAAGQVLVDGRPLDAFPRAAWWARVTAAFQEVTRFPVSVRTYVGLGDPRQVQDVAEIRRAVARAGAEPLVAGLPHGLDTLLGAHRGAGQELSGGQWQRLTIARALVRRRPLLAVLDEPTSALDSEAEREVYRSYAQAADRYRAASGGITVLVSHRFPALRLADRIVVLSQGRIVESGTHDELMSLEGIYFTHCRLQTESYR